ncbi:MAG: hypothetical protein GY929_09030 [Actinomycetia bacterium]|nr:hypothetical protein [Actinomycetes bacterium]
MAIGDLTLWDGGPGAWSNLASPGIMSGSVLRGAPNLMQPVEPGTALIALRDDDGAHWAAPPYSVGDWLAVSGTNSVGGENFLFAGIVESVSDSAHPVTGAFQQVIRAVDQIADIGVSTIEPVPAPVGAGDNIATRIGRVLDAHGFTTAPRVLAATSTTLEPITYTATALADINRAAVADHGRFFVDRGGTYVYQTKGAPPSAVTIAQDGTGDLDWRELVRVTSRNLVANFVTAARYDVALETQYKTVGIDTASAAGGVRGGVDCDVIVDSDAQLTDWAAYNAAYRSGMTQRFDPLELRTFRADWFDRLAGLEIFDGVTIKASRGGSPISVLCFVDRFDWEWTPSHKWSLRLYVSPVPVVTFGNWTLDNTGHTLPAATGLSTTLARLT